MADRKNVSVAITPCPNDIFMFHGMLSSASGVDGCDFNFIIRDIESLNEDALAGKNDVSKLSFAAYLRVSDQYRMLDAGAALGYGCGPLLLRRAGHEPQELAKSKIAVPGQLTTASLLFSLYSEGVGELVNMPFDRIMDSLADGDVDYGVVIHEGRFVYSDRGLECVVDLGEWWEGENGLPVPLGCIAAKRSLGDEFAAEFSVSLRESIARTREDPEAALPLIRKYAQEMDATVLEQHISTYVNEFSLELGPQGREAVELMARKAREAGIIQ